MKQIKISNGEIRIGYEYSDLPQKAKDKVIAKFAEENTTMFEWWDFIFDDAKTIGLIIDEFDEIEYGRGYVKGHFEDTAEHTAKKIKEEHGKSCDTYKTAQRYLKELKKLKPDEDAEDIDEVFLNELLTDYRKMLKGELENIQSEKYIIDQIEANDYLFDETGKMLWITTYTPTNAHTFNYSKEVKYPCTIEEYKPETV